MILERDGRGTRCRYREHDTGAEHLLRFPHQASDAGPSAALATLAVTLMPSVRFNRGSAVNDGGVTWTAACAKAPTTVGGPGSATVQAATTQCKVQLNGPGTIEIWFGKATVAVPGKPAGYSSNTWHQSPAEALDSGPTEADEPGFVGGERLDRGGDLTAGGHRRGGQRHRRVRQHRDRHRGEALARAGDRQPSPSSPRSRSRRVGRSTPTSLPPSWSSCR